MQMIWCLVSRALKLPWYYIIPLLSFVWVCEQTLGFDHMQAETEKRGHLWNSFSQHIISVRAVIPAVLFLVWFTVYRENCLCLLLVSYSTLLISHVFTAAPCHFMPHCWVIWAPVPGSSCPPYFNSLQTKKLSWRTGSKPVGRLWKQGCHRRVFRWLIFSLICHLVNKISNKKKNNSLKHHNVPFQMFGIFA